MHLDELNEIARAVVAPGKSILAADGSHPTIEKRVPGIALLSAGQAVHARPAGKGPAGRMLRLARRGACRPVLEPEAD